MAFDQDVGVTYLAVLSVDDVTGLIAIAKEIVPNPNYFRQEQEQPVTR